MAEPIVYYNSKLSHTGIVNYKTFENCNRHMSHKSLANLLYKQALRNLPDQVQSESNATRHLSDAQSRKCRTACDKLQYYSADRKFHSKRTGHYTFRVAFLTLTTPKGTTPQQSLAAFDHILDYLRRTANCVFVWKKELGESGHALHYHVMCNNFIPYYIVNWKWKRLLIAEGVEWPLNEQGKATDAHYRIELPRNRRQASHYISKYMSKGHELPRGMGYIWGKSEILNTLKEVTIIESDLPAEEIAELKKHAKTIIHDYVTVICCDLLKVKEYAPQIGATFEEQYIAFCEAITLPQRFFEC